MIKEHTFPVLSRNTTHPDADLSTGAVVLIDKPGGWSSFDVIRYFKRSLPEKKYGHAGTLDPMATGLLILCSGKATRSLQTFQDLPKQYTGIITLGAETPSYDAETEITATYPVDHLSEEAIRRAASKFCGPIMQKPPVYSALRQKGQRLYQLARKGESPDIQPREVHIHAFQITKVELPHVYFTIDCSKGTYIRSVAFDLGRELNNGAYLSALRRTAIGKYSVNDALSPRAFTDLILSQKTLP